MSNEPRYWLNIDWFFLFLIVWMLTSMITGRGCWAEPKDNCKNDVESVQESVEETIEETQQFIDDRF